jgi:tetratricopeptide (TPR) repeat protein
MAVQSEVARAVAREIQIKLTPREQTSLTRTHPVKPDAYVAFLKGNFFLYKGISGVLKSIDFFTQAVKLDPSYADAHAGLAQALCYVGIFGFRPSTETHPAARVAALKALELDESNASAHNVLAEVKKGYDWDLAGAVTEYLRALQLNPSHLLTRRWYAECLSRMGRHEKPPESERALTWTLSRHPASAAMRCFSFVPAAMTRPSVPASRRLNWTHSSSMHSGGRVSHTRASATFRKPSPP